MKRCFGFLVEIIQRFAAGLLVLREVVIGAVGDAFELLDAEGKLVFDVVGALGIEGALVGGDVVDVELVAREMPMSS